MFLQKHYKLVVSAKLGISLFFFWGGGAKSWVNKWSTPRSISGPHFWLRFLKANVYHLLTQNICFTNVVFKTFVWIKTLYFLFLGCVCVVVFVWGGGGNVDHLLRTSTVLYY